MGFWHCATGRSSGYFDFIRNLETNKNLAYSTDVGAEKFVSQRQAAVVSVEDVRKSQAACENNYGSPVYSFTEIYNILSLQELLKHGLINFQNVLDT